MSPPVRLLKTVRLLETLEYEVAPSSQDSAKKNQFQINSWRNKPIARVRYI